MRRIALGVLVLVACGPEPQDPKLAPAPLPIVDSGMSMDLDAAGEDAARVVAAPAAADAGPHPSARDAAEPPAGPTPFAIVATRTGSLSLHALLDGTVFVSGGLEFAKAGDGGVLAPFPALTNAAFQRERGGLLVTSFAGKWPSETWLTYSNRVTRVGTVPSNIYRWERNAWKPRAGTQGAELASVSTWKGGRVLALRLQHGVPIDPNAIHTPSEWKEPVEGPTRFEILSGPAAPLPKIDPKLCPVRAVAFTSGEVIALGSICGDPATDTRVLRWGPNDVTAASDDLGDVACNKEPLALLGARAPNDAWAGGGSDAPDRACGALAHWDGKRWSKVSIPFADAKIDDLGVTPDGTLFVAARDLWKLPPGGAWSRVALPQAPPEQKTAHPRLIAERVIAKSETDVWVVAHAAIDIGCNRTATKSYALHIQAAPPKNVVAMADEQTWTSALVNHYEPSCTEGL